MIVVGLGGGSGSGKSYMASRIKEKLPDRTLILPMDNYYRPFADKSRFERMQINFDKPETLDWNLLRMHISKLKKQQPIQMPEYSYEKSTRVGYELVEPRDIVIMEGIYALYNPEVNDQLDLKVYVAPDDDVRAVRRLKRDVVDRNRSIEFAARQYLEQTKKMHEKLVAPTKDNADVVVDNFETDEFVEEVTEIFRQDETEATRKIQDFMRQKA